MMYPEVLAVAAGQRKGFDLRFAARFPTAEHFQYLMMNICHNYLLEPQSYPLPCNPL
jgi:hypothetical protein